MEYKDILYEKKDRIAIITVNRPDRLNAYSPEMRVGIVKAIEDAADDRRDKGPDHYRGR